MGYTQHSTEQHRTAQSAQHNTEHNSDAQLYPILGYTTHNSLLFYAYYSVYSSQSQPLLSVYRVLCSTANTTRSECRVCRQCTPTNSAKPPSPDRLSPALAASLSLSLSCLCRLSLSLLCVYLWPTYTCFSCFGSAMLYQDLCSELPRVVHFDNA